MAYLAIAACTLSYLCAGELRNAHCLTAALASLIVAGERKLERGPLGLGTSGAGLVLKKDKAPVVIFRTCLALLYYSSCSTPCSWAELNFSPRRLGSAQLRFRRENKILKVFIFARFRIMRKTAPFENFTLYSTCGWGQETRNIHMYFV